MKDLRLWIDVWLGSTLGAGLQGRFDAGHEYSPDRMPGQVSVHQDSQERVAGSSVDVKVASRWLGLFEPGRLEFSEGCLKLWRGASQATSVPVANVTAYRAWSLLGRVVHLWAMDSVWYVDFGPVGVSHWRDLVELVPLVGDIETDRSARRRAKQFLAMLNEAKRQAAYPASLQS